MQVEWNDPEDPTKGFQYLYLSDADYQSIMDRAEGAAALEAVAVTRKGIPSSLLFP